MIEQYGLPAHTVGMGSKGCVVMATEPIREYRDYLTRIHHALTELAWLYHMNHGVFMTPGVDEEWTLSVLHTDADLRRYVEVFESFARDVGGLRPAAGAAASRRRAAAAPAAPRAARACRASENSSTSHALPSGAAPRRPRHRGGAPLGEQRALARVGGLVGRLDREAAAALQDLRGQRVVGERVVLVLDAEPHGASSVAALGAERSTSRRRAGGARSPTCAASNASANATATASSRASSPAPSRSPSSARAGSGRAPRARAARHRGSAATTARAPGSPASGCPARRRIAAPPTRLAAYCAASAVPEQVGRSAGALVEAATPHENAYGPPPSAARRCAASRASARAASAPWPSIRTQNSSPPSRLVNEPGVRLGGLRSAPPAAWSARSRVVAAAVVDVLEPVEVAEQQRQLGAAR